MSEAVAQNVAAPKSRLLPVLLAVIVAAALAGGGAWFVLGGQQTDPDAPAAIKPALYHKLDPAFVVNVDDRGALRYLQVELQVMARDPAVFTLIDQHGPAVRDALLDLFGRRAYAELMQPEARDALRTDALETIRTSLPDAALAAGIEAVYFTSFVVQ
jgi:flagellar protein FliL